MAVYLASTVPSSLKPTDLNQAALPTIKRDLVPSTCIPNSRLLETCIISEESRVEVGAA